MTCNLKVAKENFLKKEENLGSFATLSSDAIRMKNEDETNEVRPSYYHDIDRIIYSLSYTRYMDKTQVFTRSINDHIKCVNEVERFFRDNKVSGVCNAYRHF